MTVGKLTVCRLRLKMGPNYTVSQSDFKRSETVLHKYRRGGSVTSKYSETQAATLHQKIVHDEFHAGMVWTRVTRGFCVFSHLVLFEFLPLLLLQQSSTLLGLQPLLLQLPPAVLQLALPQTSGLLLLLQPLGLLRRCHHRGRNHMFISNLCC